MTGEARRCNRDLEGEGKDADPTEGGGIWASNASGRSWSSNDVRAGLHITSPEQNESRIQVCNAMEAKFVQRRRDDGVDDDDDDED